MQTIATLKEGDWVDETYLAVSKQVSTAKNGVTFLSIKLADKSGEIDGRLWDNADEVAGRFEREDFVRIKGVAANYQGAIQVKIKTLEKVDDSKVDVSNFIQSSKRNPDEMAEELRGVAAGISNKHLKQLLTSFLNDRAFMEAFKRAPAAKTLHHNYVGGLIEHVVELIGICRDVARHFRSIDADLLTAGAFLHDIGKVRELGIRKSIEYTTEGRLIGHITLGYEMLLEKINSIPAFPAELVMLLKHIMLSHHGEYEFGSPKRPKIQEAIIIHYLDDLSAKINNFQATLAKENVAEGDWSSFSKMHDRYLYRQAAASQNEVPASSVVDDAEDMKPVDKKKAAAQTEKLPLDI